MHDFSELMPKGVGRVAVIFTSSDLNMQDSAANGDVAHSERQKKLPKNVEQQGCREVFKKSIFF